MGQDRQEALTDAYIAALARVREQAKRQVGAMFTGPKSWREDDADKFAKRAVPVVEGAQRAAAALTEDYLTRVLADQSGEPYRPQGGDPSKSTGAAVRNGVDPEVVYRRPHQEVWASLAEDRRRKEALERAQVAAEGSGESVQERLARLARENRERNARRGTRVQLDAPLPKPNDKPLTEAVKRGLNRAEQSTLTDIELAVTHAARDRLADEPRVKFFRRVLTGAESCGLCVIASTQRYHKKNLLPIHNNCDCVISPIYGDKDPGRIINSKRVSDEATQSGETLSGVPIFEDDQLLNTDLLTDDVHKAILEEFGEMAFDGRRLDYRKVLLVQEHGELGPVLTVARHKFTQRQIDQRDLAAPAGSFSNRPGRRTT